MEENAVQNPPTQSTEPPIQPPKKKLPVKWLVLALILIVLVMSGISANFLLKKNASKTTTTSPLTPTKIVDETTNWKTYEGNGFSFRYPAGWKIEKDTQKLVVVTKTIYVLEYDRKTKASESASISVNKSPLDANITLDNWIKTNYLRSNDMGLFNLTILSSKAAKVAEEEAVQIWVPGAGGYVDTGVLILHNGYGFNISAGGIDFNSGEPTRVFKGVLSTFKFTDQTSLTENFLEIPEYGIKFELTENIKDAYYLPQTASKGYIYLKVHSLDSEEKCKSDPSSTAAIARQGKNDPIPFDLSYDEFKTRFSGAEIGNYYYYIDLAQYACADSPTGRALLEKVRKEFSAASKTITAL